MIAACPKCAARYRIAKEKITPEGVRMRCGRCEAVFRVRPPAAPSPASAASTQATAPAKVSPPSPVASATESHAQPSASPKAEAASVNREKLVLIAIPDVELAKRTASEVEGRGLHSSIVHDGVEAMLEVQRQLPRVVVLSATLPRMYGFQICEVMKRNESLRSIPVVLLGSIYHKDRYRRAPNELYGADAYLEDQDLPDGLSPILERIGMPMTPPASTAHAVPADERAAIAPPPSAPVAPEPAAVEAPGPAEVEPATPPAAMPPPVAKPGPAPGAPAAPSEDALTGERTKAERLARIIVSDIILYNEEKFAEAVKRGNVVEMMSPDLEEGRGLFRARISEQVREEQDYLVEELLRVARLRGMS